MLRRVLERNATYCERVMYLMAMVWKTLVCTLVGVDQPGMHDCEQRFPKMAGQISGLHPRSPAERGSSLSEEVHSPCFQMSAVVHIDF